MLFNGRRSISEKDIAKTKIEAFRQIVALHFADDTYDMQL